MPIQHHRPAAGVPLARRLRPLIQGLLALALLAGMAYLVWPSSLGGCSTLTIVSGHSMEPTYFTGDLVWSRCGEPSVGDVVVYSPPDTNGAQVIHRIVGGNAADGWVLQGDNNDFLDPWSPDNSQIVGIATVHIPHLGSIVYGLGNPYLWGSLLIIAAAICLWPQNQNQDPDQDPDQVQGSEADGGSAGPDSGPAAVPGTGSAAGVTGQSSVGTKKEGVKR